MVAHAAEFNLIGVGWDKQYLPGEMLLLFPGSLEATDLRKPGV